jgi:hypothetical protein
MPILQASFRLKKWTQPPQSPAIAVFPPGVRVVQKKGRSPNGVRNENDAESIQTSGDGVGFLTKASRADEVLSSSLMVSPSFHRYS